MYFQCVSQWSRSLSIRFSAHGGNTVDCRGHVAVGVGRRLTGVLPELEVRTGTGQPVVEGRLQGHRDQRPGEQQHFFENIQSERPGGRGRPCVVAGNRQFFYMNKKQPHLGVTQLDHTWPCVPTRHENSWKRNSLTPKNVFTQRFDYFWLFKNCIESTLRKKVMLFSMCKFMPFKPFVKHKTTQSW